MLIRAEKLGDAEAIHDITAMAFAPKAFSDGTEAALPAALNADGDMVLSLVAVDTEIVGHVAFSTVTFDGRDMGWIGLGPVAVHPDRQLQGIGSALITQGLDQIKALGAKGCVLVGDPKYYHRFGFVGDGALRYQDLPVELVQWVSFDGSAPKGILGFAPAFGD
ncbi:GNAT family N-acetyltransferase [Algirhabdus cladophorae]|uniref:GNAT family N-acetyltransferase n=1 Tax=Algirhabdus cladophorae TaxID=3377108 RepID=UPI003B84B3D8